LPKPAWNSTLSLLTAKAKIKTAREVQLIRGSARERGLTVVFTNGCFDLLHVGHVRYLEAARQLGDMLIVGVNSDTSISRIKGPLRPINVEADRIEIVSALHCVDYAVLFETPDPLTLIELLEPDVLVKGADWPVDRIVGADVVLRGGGRVTTVPLVPQVSTTSVIERILDRFTERRT
jgi:D-glycero-beta-D-manno-heptose 1-phosphate adenylyltransferase